MYFINDYTLRSQEPQPEVEIGAHFTGLHTTVLEVPMVFVNGRPTKEIHVKSL